MVMGIDMPFVVFRECIPHEVSYCGMERKIASLLPSLLLGSKKWKCFSWDFFATFGQG